MNSRKAWYTVGASSTHLDAGASSYSLLHSIYGSQVSQLPFSDYDSEASLIATTQSEHYVQPRASPTLKRRLSRPKSSPASVIAAREQLRSNPTQPTRPGSALPRQQRPGSAARRIARGRPSSAAVGRPASAASVVRGGASPSRRRPKTAMGFQRTPSLSGSSTVLLDLEEEEEGEDIAPIIRETAPVKLTHTPEYFDFWQGKPLRERDFGVKVHKRKPWRRPKSDYGTRFFNRNSKDKENDGRNGVGGEGGDDDGLGGLETLIEKEGDSSLSSRRGSRDFGALGDGGTKNKAGGDDSHQLGISGEGLGNSRRGSKDFGDRNKMGLRDRSTSSTRGRHKKSSDTDKQGGDKGSKGDDGLGSTRMRQSEWGDQDGTATADDDDYFKNSTDCLDKLSSGTGSSSKRRTLLPSISTKTNTNLTANDNHVENIANKPDTTTKENTEPVNNVHRKRERRVFKQLQPTSTEHLPALVDDSLYDCDTGKALAAASWMDGGADTSSNTTRFELPMDMKTLERMTPLEYLNTHCVISKRRMAHCSKVFSKLNKGKTLSLSHKEVIQGLIQAHHNCVTEDQASSVLDLVQMGSEVTISSVKLFAAICCFAERMLNLFFLPLSKKEVIETVDFEALDWKLRNCCITDSLRILFSHL